MQCNSKHQNHSLNFSDKTYGHWTSRVSLFQSRPEFLHDCFSSIFSRTALSAWLFWAKYFTMDSTHSTFFLLLLRYNDEAKPPKNRSEMFNPKLIENGSRYGNVSKVATHSRLSWPFFCLTLMHFKLHLELSRKNHASKLCKFNKNSQLEHRWSWKKNPH